VNDWDWSDRVGLAMTFGLSDPEDTLGIGLSIDIANGFSITATQLYRRMDRLDGVAEGDAFSGAADTIPKVETWEEEFVVGLSIDGRYITKFFSSND
jgi:hypothetical protein